MYNLNVIHLIGNLGQDPQLGTSTRGAPFARLSIATSERWQDDHGVVQSRTEWHTVVCWEKHAEAAKQLHKGSYVSVEGPLRSRQYTGHDGVNRRVWEIRASHIGLLPPLGPAPNEVTAEADFDPPTRHAS